MKGIEIERKWLVGDDIFESLVEAYGNDLQFINLKHVKRTYLSMDPEFRISKILTAPQDLSRLVELKIPPAYVAAIKTGTGIKRTEVEFDISEETYNLIKEVINPAFIEKSHWKYSVPNMTGNARHNIEVNQVFTFGGDSFCYVEVEFDTLEEANAYIPEFAYCSDVTNDDRWKMKNVWQRITQTGMFR